MPHQTTKHRARDLTRADKLRMMAEVNAITEKACTECKVVKPCNREFFHMKRFLDLTTFVTVDVCKQCVSDKLKAQWAKRKWDAYDYEVHKAEELVHKMRRERGADPHAPQSEWSIEDRAVFAMTVPKEAPTAPRPQ